MPDLILLQSRPQPPAVWVEYEIDGKRFAHNVRLSRLAEKAERARQLAADGHEQAERLEVQADLYDALIAALTAGEGDSDGD